MTYNYVEIGEIFRKRRTELGRDLPGMAEETKISEKYLEAIENGGLGEFPSIIYYKLFASSYAKELGLDPEVLFAQQNDLEEPAKAPDAPVSNSDASSLLNNQNVPTVEKRTRYKAILWPIIIIALGVIAVAIILIKGKTPQELQQPTATGPTVTQREEEEGIPAFDTMAIDSELSANLPVRGMRLNITAKETCWMVVVADGDTLVFGNLNPGASHDFRAINSFNISAGNPRGIELRLNDTLMKPLSSGGLPVKNLQISRENARSFYLLPEDSAHAGD